MRPIIIKILTIVLLIFSSTSIIAQYSITQSVLGNGGDIMQSNNYTAYTTVGQTLIGNSRNSSLLIKSGYWYQLINTPTEVEKKPDSLPKTYALYQNYPNPFNPSTTIKYSIPHQSVDGVKGETSNTKLIVYDILGREVATLVNQKQQPGNYEVTFNAAGLPSGTYLYRITVGNFSATKKLLLLK